MSHKDKETVICIYDDKAPSIDEKILEAFEKYLKLTLKNTNSL